MGWLQLTEKPIAALPRWVKALLLLLTATVLTQSYFLFELSHNRGSGAGSDDKKLSSSRAATGVSSAPFSRLPRFQQPWSGPPPLEPFPELGRISKEMKRLFEEAFSGALLPFPLRGDWQDAFMADQSLTDLGDAYEVTVKIGDVENPNIKAVIDGQTLTIEATVEVVESQRGQSPFFHREQKSVQKIVRSITFPEPVDAAGMKSEYEGGFLRIHVPKARKRP